MTLRKRYSKKEKFLALYEYSLGAKAQDALFSIGFDMSKSNLKDKKYALKIINKWKKEIYFNRDLNTLINKTGNEYYFINLFDKNKNNEYDYIFRMYFDKIKAQNSIS